MSDIMLYKNGTQIVCGPHSLDYIIVDDSELAKYLALGWVDHPDNTSLPEPVLTKKASMKKAAKDGENEG
ncbi:TPA: hypothetical protein ACPZUA_003885 [Yersinia enterocolitica]